MVTKHKIIYCSWNEYKKEEWNTARHFKFESDVTFDDIIEFEFRNVETQEPLLCDLEDMVRAKAKSAYSEVKMPCVVEHAGLVLGGYEDKNYPGGLTQPMWDALGAEKFVKSCATLSRSATARAVIGYCDGASVQTFVGNTQGVLRSNPAGLRRFYWDTIFCPEEFENKTYAEIADKNLKNKLEISQSVKALRQLVEYCKERDPILFPGL